MGNVFVGLTAGTAADMLERSIAIASRRGRVVRRRRKDGEMLVREGEFASRSPKLGTGQGFSSCLEDVEKSSIPGLSLAYRS